MTLDRSHLSRQTGGDDELEREILALFAGQCTALVPRVSCGGADEQALASHTLKGAALAVGAFGVASAADAIEGQATESRERVTDDLVRALETAVRELRRELAFIEGADPDPGSTGK